jgi:hypothetical protein
LFCKPFLIGWNQGVRCSLVFDSNANWPVS